MNVWIDYDNTSGFLIGSTCPLDYCHPFSSTLINLNELGGADKQCANNRAGVLCGGCKQNFSLSLGQSGCISCGRLWPLYMFLTIVAGLIIGAALLCIILCLKVTVAVGTLNGFIFSANILKAIFPYPRKNDLTYPISILNLDLEFGINICFYPGLTAYVKTWLQLFFPVYLHLLVFLVIIGSNYSSRFANFIGKRNPVETLATLLFLSYSKLLQFIISVFAYVRIQRPNGNEQLVWLLDGRIRYGEPKHIAMIIAALIVFVIVFIYTFVLLFWQLLIKCPNSKVLTLFRSVRLTEAIELYHVPFNSVHRYWTGLLLLIRIIVYMVATLTSSSGNGIETNITIIFLLAFLLIGKTFKVRVYKKWPLDVLESVLIYLAIVTAASEWYSTAKDDTRTAIATTITLSIILLFLIIIVAWYHVRTYAPRSRCFSHMLRSIRNSIRKGFCSGSTCNDSSTDIPSQPEIVVDTRRPRALHCFDINRNNSILNVMGSPLQHDYQELQVQQLMARDREEVDQQDYVQNPPPPTVKVLTGPC